MNSNYCYLMLIYFVFGISSISYCEEDTLEELLLKYDKKEFFVIRKIRDSKGLFNKTQNLVLSDKQEITKQKELTEVLDNEIKDKNPQLKKIDIEYWGLKEYHWGVKDKNGYLHDLLIVNKGELGKSYLQRIKKKYKDILASFTQKNTTNVKKYYFSADLFDNAESRLASILIDEEILLKISPNLLLKDEEVSLDKESINRTINELKSTYIKGQNALNSKMQAKTDTIFKKLGQSLKSFGNYINTQSQQIQYRISQ